MSRKNVRLSMLNEMAGTNFEDSLQVQKSWGITDLDLKYDVYPGKQITELTKEQAQAAKLLSLDMGFEVCCLSTNLFYDEVGLGEAHFEENHLGPVSHVLELAEIFKPRFIRLLSPYCEAPKGLSPVGYLQDSCPWIFDQFKKAIDQINAAGFEAVIENEVHHCVFSTPDEMVIFFEIINKTEQVGLIWDIGNQWQMGSFPTLDDYQKLKHLIKYVHLKGGMANKGDDTLTWAGALEHTPWPVIGLVEQVIKDNLSPVICLNPPHGNVKTGYDMNNLVKRDIDFLRASIKEVA